MPNQIRSGDSRPNVCFGSLADISERIKDVRFTPESGHAERQSHSVLDTRALLSMLKVVIPPGGSAKPHIHKGFELAIYLIQGRVETRYGEGLKKSVVNEAGDFIFVPPDLPHQPVNLSDTEPAIAIVARNDPEEQEHVILLPAEAAPKN